MARPYYPAKVNRTVRYKTATGKWRTCKITAVTNSTTATLKSCDRVTVYTSKVRRTDPKAPASNDKWRPA